MRNIIPVSAIDSILSSVAWARVGSWSAASLGNSSFTSNEVPLPIDDNDTRSRVGEPGLKLSKVGWVLRSGVATTGGANCEAEGLADDSLRSGAAE